MKPDLIFINENNGMVSISKEDLIALVDKAYEAGQRNGNITIPLTPYTPSPTWDYYKKWEVTTS